MLRASAAPLVACWLVAHARPRPLSRALLDDAAGLAAEDEDDGFEQRWGMRVGSYRPGAVPARQSRDVQGSRAMCAEPGEDCRASGCCGRPGQICFAKNEYFSGCRDNCTPGEPELGAKGDLAEEAWTCRLASPACACSGRCDGGAGCPSFPEVHYIYLPESEEDLRREKAMAEEMRQHSCGEEGIVRIPGVNPAGWPEGLGRYDKVEWFGRLLPRVEGVGDDAPWWALHNLAYAEVDEEGRSTWLLRGLQHHAGCSLSHLVAWMGARSRGLAHVVVAESDSLPSYWWQVYVGDEAEFDSGVLALLQDAPDGWDVILLDKGKFGVKPGRQSLKSVTRECWRSPYHIYNWTGEGVAGLTLYMVSSRFLDKVPQMIHDHSLDMVDAWMNLRCNPEEAGGGQLQCYSAISADRDLGAGADGAEPAERGLMQGGST